jgi:hypothetical protein
MIPNYKKGEILAKNISPVTLNILGFTFFLDHFIGFPQVFIYSFKCEVDL